MISGFCGSSEWEIREGDYEGCEVREVLMNREQLEILGKQVLDALYEVHRELGPGLLENAYEMALAHEFSSRGISFERQKPVGLTYKGVKLDCGFRIDVLVAEEIVLELKSVETLPPIHDAQVVDYLRLAAKPLGFLVNFNVPRLKDGIKRCAKSGGSILAAAGLRCVKARKMTRLPRVNTDERDLRRSRRSRRAFFGMDWAFDADCSLRISIEPIRKLLNKPSRSSRAS